MNNHQFIISKTGTIVSQQGSLIELLQPTSLCLLECFPFLEHLWPHLRTLRLQNQLFQVPMVAAPHPLLPGHYHFNFRCIKEQPWTLMLDLVCMSQMAERMRSQRLGQDRPFSSPGMRF
jgi:hypothetical protein